LLCVGSILSCGLDLKKPYLRMLPTHYFNHIDQLFTYGYFALR
jgi:hypothetical protein